jgi:hypothetical protein
MRATKESNDFTSVKSLADYHICEQFVTLFISILYRVGILAILIRILFNIILSYSSKITYFSLLIMRQSPYRFLIRAAGFKTYDRLVF